MAGSSNFLKTSMKSHSHESQRFNQWWLWGILILAQAIVLFAVMQSDEASLRDVFYIPVLCR